MDLKKARKKTKKIKEKLIKEKFESYHKTQELLKNYNSCSLPDLNEYLFSIGRLSKRKRKAREKRVVASKKNHKRSISIGEFF